MSHWPSANFIPDKRQILNLPSGNFLSLPAGNFSPHAMYAVRACGADWHQLRKLSRFELCSKRATINPLCWKRGRGLGRERNNASKAEVSLPPQKSELQRIKKKKAARAAQKHPAVEPQRKKPHVQRAAYMPLHCRAIRAVLHKHPQ